MRKLNMDNLFSVNFFEHTAQTNLPSEAKHQIRIVVDFGHSVSTDYIERLISRGYFIQDFSKFKIALNVIANYRD